MEDNFIIFHEDVLGYEFLLVWRNDNELVFCSRRKCIYGFLNHRLKRIIIIRYAEMSIFFFFEREKFWFISKNLYNNTSYTYIIIPFDRYSSIIFHGRLYITCKLRAIPRIENKRSIRSK